MCEIAQAAALRPHCSTLTATEIQRGTASAGEAEDLFNLLRGRLDIYDVLATAAQVRAYADAHLPPMRPLTYPVGPRPADRAGGIMIVCGLAGAPHPEQRRRAGAHHGSI